MNCGLIKEKFLNKPVVLVQSGNFVLRGIITEIKDDTVVFKTDRNESLIECSVIVGIRLQQ